MMLFRYRVTLYDPLFYAREGLCAAYTPPVLHATAVNHAVTAAMCLHAERQPFVMAEANGGMDVPRYADSRASPLFYFTPGGVCGAPGDWSEFAKGDGEGFLFHVKAGEILKATRLHFLPPETQFTGLGVATSEMKFPKKIRLGSFRGVARLEIERAEGGRRLPGRVRVTHPVDPLVSEVVRGVMMNLLPYPVVESAVCTTVYELDFARAAPGPAVARMAWPKGYPELPMPEPPPRTGNAVI